MSPVKPLVKYSMSVGVLALIFVAAAITFGQSRDENAPTPIAAFPLNGNLGSGTYYYQVPESVVSEGSANAVLDVTPPDGGGSMTVTFSGRRCCPPEAYIGVTTGLADRIREATRFDIPGQQPLLVTVYIAVGAKQTIGFRLNFNIGATSSGVIVTPPSPSPSPSPSPRPPLTPTTPFEGICTDLSLQDGAVIVDVGSTKVIKGLLRNISSTAYVGYARQQWVEVNRQVAGSPAEVIGRVGFTTVPAGGTIPYSVTDASPPSGRRIYGVRIINSTHHGSRGDRLKTNDDCNGENNGTVALPGLPLDDRLVEPELLKKDKP